MCKLQDKQKQLIDTGLFCILKKDQNITIPKSTRKTLALMAGDEVTISMTNNSRELIIEKLTSETLENIMIITKRGSIRIPEELKRYLCLKAGDMFRLYLTTNNQIIVLKHVKKHKITAQVST